MRRGWNLFALTLLVAVLALAGCESTSPEEDQAAAQAAAWAALQQAKVDLDAKRQELTDFRAQLAEAPEEETPAEEAPEPEAGEEGGGEGEEGGGEGEEGGEEPLSPEEQLAALEKEIGKAGEEFAGQLTGFLNSQEMYEGEPLTEVQRAAFDMKADEDILVAQEYIDKGGNYQKAIDIFTTALYADPTSEKLMAAKAHAETMRYMSEERFAQVKKGQTRDEVRELLGTPKANNIREFDKGVIGWFYPKEVPRTAAGIYFRERKGEYKVYESDFDAIKAEEGE